MSNDANPTPELSHNSTDDILSPPPDEHPPSPLFFSPAFKAHLINTKSQTTPLADLWLSEEDSDLKVICGDYSWPVHRSIVCSQSDFFRGALRGDFKEAHEGRVVITDETPMNDHRLLSFFYLGDYERYPSRFYEMCTSDDKYDEERWPVTSVADESYATRCTLEMRRIGDKYGCFGLLKEAEEQMTKMITWACLSDVSVTLAIQVFRATGADDCLRTATEKVLFRLFKDIAEDGPHRAGEIRPDLLHALLEENNDFAMELVRVFLGIVPAY
ncbi:hypothetical protein BJ508DRAFT_364285 [Ascobolus immersus RN42]|uniref:BTB domain-containing protein n=1 Tax=Ascobolus immersus RN42 TaxID=1160509 RepID=A0A3N4HVT0_ASCIM|nr:hypothetical protein BJ508DRAFT_364285 [Ascobolus immersus RN42]